MTTFYRKRDFLLCLPMISCDGNLGSCIGIDFRLYP